METKNLEAELTITKLSSFDGVNKEKFAALIHSGFKKTLIPTYFSDIAPDHICLAEHNGRYVGAIVVEAVPELPGVNYLDKIVVAADYQGMNIGKTLWQHLNGYSQKVVWRAKKENPIIDFYRKKSDGCINLLDQADFMFFYYGLSSKELEKALVYAINKKPSLV